MDYCILAPVSTSVCSDFFSEAQRNGVLQTRVLVRETLEEANKFERLPKSMSECQTMFLSTKCVVFAEGYGLLFVETSDDVGACIKARF